MKKTFLLILIIIFLTGFLAGCELLYGVDNFVLPNDEDFINLVKELQSPERVCEYMENNFTYKPSALYNLSPYELYQTKEGDCNDFSTFVVFILNYCSYETYQIVIYYKNENPFSGHSIAVFREYDRFNFTDNWEYFEIGAGDFGEIVEYDCWLLNKIWSKYIVYDYNLNVVEDIENL